jgi:hypothetical protein
MDENMKGEHFWMNSIHNDVGDDDNNDVDKCW